MERVLISGGSGFIGSHLTRLLLDKGFAVSHLTRNPGKAHLTAVRQFHWDPENNIIDKDAVEHDYIVHLAGADISEKRWTTKRKRILYDSRVISASLLTDAILKSKYKPKAYISASAIGYYGAVTSKHPYKEHDKPGDDFLAKLCVDWENAASPLSENNIRTVFLRTAFVVASHEGGLEKLIKAAKYRMLSPLGDGDQYMPWIHISDLVHSYLFAIMNEKLRGPYNACADDIRTNTEFTRTLAEACGSSILLPNIPEFMLKIALGDIATVLTKGSPVSNEKLRRAGFEFVFENLHNAINSCLNERLRL